jgi:hypothetical protein
VFHGPDLCLKLLLRLAKGHPNVGELVLNGGGVSCVGCGSCWYCCRLMFWVLALEQGMLTAFQIYLLCFKCWLNAVYYTICLPIPRVNLFSLLTHGNNGIVTYFICHVVGPFPHKACTVYNWDERKGL